VTIARTDESLVFRCIGQSRIAADIKELGVNRVVIGACAPMLHEQTFRGAVTRAGSEPVSLSSRIGLREQDSWVHGHDKQGATDKALRLMSAGVAKARLLQPLEPIRLGAERHALVIGGGVAGLRSLHWTLRDRACAFHWLRRSPFLGGRMAQLESVFPPRKRLASCYMP
jgi:heterodisulfide reductase subunit A